MKSKNDTLESNPKPSSVDRSMDLHSTMLATPKKLFERLQSIPNKNHKGDFKTFVARLNRPCYRLSADDCTKVELKAGGSDVLLFDGTTQVTWGYADGGMALMPLRTPL